MNRTLYSEGMHSYGVQDGHNKSILAFVLKESQLSAGAAQINRMDIF